MQSCPFVPHFTHITILQIRPLQNPPRMHPDFFPANCHLSDVGYRLASNGQHVTIWRPNYLITFKHMLAYTHFGVQISHVHPWKHIGMVLNRQNGHVSWYALWCAQELLPMHDLSPNLSLFSTTWLQSIVAHFSSVRQPIYIHAAE